MNKIKLLTVFLLPVILLACPLSEGDGNNQPGPTYTPGDFDESFNGTGYVVFNGYDNASHVHAVQNQSDDKIIGLIDNGSDNVMIRLLATGEADVTFGADGDGIVHYPAMLPEPTSVAVDADYIYVSGESATDDFYAIARFNADGILDTGFGTAGCIEIENGVIRDLEIQDDGKLLAAGYYNDQLGGTDEAAVWRFSLDGTPDTGFADNGTFIHADAAGSDSRDRINAITLDSAGNIYAAGDSGLFLTVWKVDGSGSLDPLFHYVGYYVHLAEESYGHSVLVHGNRIFIAGSSYNDDVSYNYLDSTVFCFTAAGEPDITFAGTGIFTYSSYMFLDDEFNSLVVDSENRIIAAGESVFGFNCIRLFSDGTLDDFGEYGYFHVSEPYELSGDFYTKGCGANSMVQLSSGTLIMGGLLKDQEINPPYGRTYGAIYAIHN